MEGNISIPRDHQGSPATDYDFLKKEFIQKLQRLSGENWTDYNIHDPGVTLIEILCYALTELGYQLERPIQDLVKSSRKGMSGLLPSAEQILFSAPLSLNDYNRLFLDIEGIQLATIVPSAEHPDFKGMYELHVHLQEGADAAIVRQQIFELYHRNARTKPTEGASQIGLQSNRSLGEDLLQVHFLLETPFRFGLELECADDFNRWELIANLQNSLAQYLAPPVTFHSFDELKKQGLPLSEICQGPRLIHGFIPPQELKKLRPRTEIRISDLMRRISQLPEVKQVQNLFLIDRFDKKHAWVCPVEHKSIPILDSLNSFLQVRNPNGNVIFESKLEHPEQNPLNRGPTRTVQKIPDFSQNEVEPYSQSPFYSIQNEFPRIYGIGETGLPAKANPKRKGQAKQLQGYLLFFEQVLSNHFAEIGSLPHLFSLEEIDQAQYFQALLDIPGSEFLYHPFISKFQELFIDLEDEALVYREWQRFKVGFQAWQKHLRAHPSIRSQEKNVLQLWKEFRQVQDENPYWESIFRMDRSLYRAIENRQEFLEKRGKMLDHFLARFAIDYREYNFAFEDSPPAEQHIQNKNRALLNLSHDTLSRGSGRPLLPGAPSSVDNRDSGLEERLKRQFSIPKRPFAYLSRVQNAAISLRGPLSSGSIELEWEAESQDQAIREIFAIGTKPEAYEQGNLKRQFYLKKEGGERAGVLYVPRRQKKAQSPVDPITIAEKLRKEGREFESLFLVEHIWLRPQPSCPAFGFAIQAPSTGELLFESSKFRSYGARQEILRQLLEVGKQPSNYSAVRLAHNQYKVRLQGPGFEMLSPLFLQSEAQANEEMERYLQEFQLLFREHIAGNASLTSRFQFLEPDNPNKEYNSGDLDFALLEAGLQEEHFSFVKKENDFHLLISHPAGLQFRSYRGFAEKKDALEEFLQFNMANFREHYQRKLQNSPWIKYRTSRFEHYAETEDPFSQIVTYVLPDWPPRFQNPAFMALLQKTILAETPAHLVVNIKSLPFSVFKHFGETFEEFWKAFSLLKRKQLERSMALDQLRPDNSGNRAKYRSLKELNKEIEPLELRVSLLGDQVLEIIS